MPRVAKTIVNLPATDWTGIHPAAQTAFDNFEEMISASKYPLVRFEAYRSPMRQQELKSHIPPVTKVGPWRSVHQYGFAVDYVAKPQGEWSWEHFSKEDWDDIHQLAADCGLSAPIKWDPGHLVLRDWRNHLARWLDLYQFT